MTKAAYKLFLQIFVLLGIPGLAVASGGQGENYLDLTTNWVGYLSLVLFVAAHFFINSRFF